jgi:hypothetical protein
MSVNIANIDKTIARIRANQNFKFNMGSWGASVENVEMDNQGHFCGTSACIAGFAMLADNTFPVVTKDRKFWDDNDVLQTIQVDVLQLPVENPDNEFFIGHGIEVLGLTEAQGVALFTPFQDWAEVEKEDATDELPRGFYYGPEFMKATEDQAIAVLEHLKATGEVNWTVSGIKPLNPVFYPAWEKKYGEAYSVSKSFKSTEKVSETA